MRKGQLPGPSATKRSTRLNHTRLLRKCGLMGGNVLTREGGFAAGVWGGAKRPGRGGQEGAQTALIPPRAFLPCAFVSRSINKSVNYTSPVFCALASSGRGAEREQVRSRLPAGQGAAAPGCPPRRIWRPAQGSSERKRAPAPEATQAPAGGGQGGRPGDPAQGRHHGGRRPTPGEPLPLPCFLTAHAESRDRTEATQTRSDGGLGPASCEPPTRTGTQPESEGPGPPERDLKTEAAGLPRAPS